MFYTVYKTTNLINGKFYVGVHKTNEPNDSYLGSGKLLLKAIEKYGIESFRKEVLFIFDNPTEAFDKEAEIVTTEFLSENNTYNLKVGGQGGFDYLNRTGLNISGVKKRDYNKISAKVVETKSKRVYTRSDDFREKMSKAQRGIKKPGVSLAQKGVSKSEEHRLKISESIKKKNREKREHGAVVAQLVANE